MANTNNIRSIKIVHNGYKIEWVKTIDEANQYINSVLAPHLHLNPQKICDKLVSRNDNKKECTRLIRYRYHTVYEEVFLLDISYK